MSFVVVQEGVVALQKSVASIITLVDDIDRGKLLACGTEPLPCMATAKFANTRN